MKIASSLFLAFIFGCGLVPQDSVAAKTDQMIGLFLQYDAVEEPTAEMQAELVTQALALVGVDASVVDATVPSATALQVAAKVVEKHPDLAPFEAMIAKLYTLILYGAPA